MVFMIFFILGEWAVFLFGTSSDLGFGMDNLRSDLFPYTPLISPFHPSLTHLPYLTDNPLPPRSHALQLRQAKLSFPDVHLLVGVNSDTQVHAHKARTVMNHAERLEAVRHCRWVDEVVEDAPWVITSEFLERYEVDYVAHDEEAYESAGLEDVYAFVKDLGGWFFFFFSWFRFWSFVFCVPSVF